MNRKDLVILNVSMESFFIIESVPHFAVDFPNDKRLAIYHLYTGFSLSFPLKMVEDEMTQDFPIIWSILEKALNILQRR